MPQKVGCAGLGGGLVVTASVSPLFFQEEATAASSGGRCVVGLGVTENVTGVL